MKQLLVRTVGRCAGCHFDLSILLRPETAALRNKIVPAEAGEQKAREHLSAGRKKLRTLFALAT